MRNKHSAKVENLFREIISHPSSEWDTFFCSVREFDVSVLAEVRALLDADLQAEKIGFLEPQFLSLDVRPDANGAIDANQIMRIKARGKTHDLTFDRNCLSKQSRRCLGRYELQERIGIGGFAEVWRAKDPLLERYVAIKIPRSDRSVTNYLIKSFLSEARKLAIFKVPGIVRVLDTVQDGDLVFVVSELMEGGSLADIQRQGQPSIERALQLVADVAEALHRAHQQGLVHRDIKPANILLDLEGRPHLADFGVAITEEEQLFELPSMVGTVAYMPPEQACGNSQWASPQSDVYSLGVVLYELLTGRSPFTARTFVQYRDQVLNCVPRSPKLINHAISGEVEKICLKCLAKAPKDRYTTALDLAGALRSLPELAGSGHVILHRLITTGTILVALVLAIILPRSDDLQTSYFGNTETDSAKKARDFFNVHDNIDSVISVEEMLNNRRMAFWVLDSGGVIDFEDTRTPRIVDRTDVPSDHFRLLHINISSRTDITEDDFAKIGQLIHLRHLQLSETNIDNQTVHYIGRLSSLRSLWLNYTTISDIGLQRLQSLTQLRHLDLSGSRITDDGLRVLGNMQELEFLDVSETEVTSNGISILTRFAKLKVLKLRLTSIDDDSVRYLKQMSNLEELDVRDTCISADSIATLRKELIGCKILN